MYGTDPAQSLPPLPAGWRLLSCQPAGGHWRCTLEHDECGQVSGSGPTEIAAIQAAMAEVATGDEAFSKS